MTEEIFNCPEKIIFVKSEAVYEPVGSNLQALFL